jgi:predicted O-methyltransferase YrrM
MTVLVDRDDAKVRVGENDGRRLVVVERRVNGSWTSESWETRYPIDLIEHVLRVKGPTHLCDEMKRDESPRYVEHRLRWDILGFVRPEEFSGKRVLDFGSGCGASTMVLARLLSPNAQIVGVELVPEFVELARARSRHYGVDDRVEYVLSPDSDSLPDGIGRFDFIVLSAVFEHLLPDERAGLIPLLWSHLETGGILFLDQTPHRWFPIEMHTTGLPMINYMPWRIAREYARRFSRRVRPDEPWEMLLRRGLRGSTAGEVMRIVNREGRKGENLSPSLLGAKDHIDLWYQMSSGSRKPATKKAMMVCFKILRGLTGATIVPTLSLAVKKVG